MGVDEPELVQTHSGPFGKEHPLDRSSSSSLSPSSSQSPPAAFDVLAWRRLLSSTQCIRCEERQQLLDALDKLQDNPAPGLLLITGRSGSGKTHLATTLRTSVEAKGGYFLTGAFHRLQPTPYAALISAFDELAWAIEARGEDTVNEIHSTIVEALGHDVGVLTRLIPSLQRIIRDKFVEDASTRAELSTHRHVFVLYTFLKAICSPAQPIVLLLDDIHYADQCSIDTWIKIITEGAVEGLLLIGTSEDQISSDAYLSTKIRDLEHRGMLEHVALKHLSDLDIGIVIATVMQTDKSRTRRLARVLAEHTEGNLVYLIELLGWLYDTELLQYEEPLSSWTWDDDEIELTLKDKNPTDLLTDRLRELPKHAHETLKVASCLGSHVDEHLLEYIQGGSVHDALNIAVTAGLLVENQVLGGYLFAQNDLQTAVYDLIPQGEQEELHLTIGRRLWRHLDEGELDRYLFVLIQQLRLGKRLITKEKERAAVATLCLHAGTQAARSWAFNVASDHLHLGIVLLGERGWRDEYDLSLALHNAAAEMDMCSGKTTEMNQSIESVLKNAKSYVDKAQAYSTRVYSLGVDKQQHHAIDVGLEVLRGLGERFPSRFQLFHLWREANTIERILKGKSDEQILRLPLLSDKEKLLCLQLLNLICLDSIFVRQQLVPFLGLRMMKLTLQYGLSVYASSAFSAYSMVCIGGSRKLSVEAVETSCRYAHLGLKFLERFEAREFIPRVYAGTYGVVLPWKHALEKSLDPLLKAYQVGLQTGDFEGACLCAALAFNYSFDVGRPLDEIRRHWRAVYETMVENRQSSLLDISRPSVEAIYDFMGLSDDPLAANGNSMEYEASIKAAQDRGSTLSVLGVRFRRMMVALIFNDIGLAEEMSNDMDDIWIVPPSMERVDILFYWGLTAFACVQDGRSPRRNKRKGKRILREYRRLALLTPQNCQGKFFLLQAELASIEGQHARACQKFLCARRMAHGVFMLAQVNERTGRHLLRQNDKATAHEYFREACRLYMEWGGVAKAKQLQSEVEALYPQ